jgi:fatty acid elongase 3
MQNSTFQFSIDRPFGIYFHDYFVQAYTLVTGKNPNNFEFIEGVTPLSTRYEVAISFITYLAVIFGGKLLMRNFPVIKLQFIFQLHNLLLTLSSLALLILFAEQLIPIVFRNGIFHSVCHNDAWTQRLELLYYINYLIKYWELTDTVFLVLRKKNLGKI